LHPKFLVRHFSAAKLQLDAHFVSPVQKFFAVPDFRQVIVIVDVNAELDFLELRAGRPFVFVVLGKVVTEFSERDDFADRRIGRRRNFDKVEPAILSFAQGVGQLHDAELLAAGT
jgi:hypothetical protein